MSNYNCCSKSSFFQVTDVEELKRIVKGIPQAELIERYINGQNKYMLAAYDTLFAGYTLDEDGNIEPETEYDVIERIQKILPPGEAVIFIEIGNEKLCNVNAQAAVFTRNTLRETTLADAALTLVEEITGSDSIYTDF